MFQLVFSMYEHNARGKGVGEAISCLAWLTKVGLSNVLPVIAQCTTALIQPSVSQLKEIAMENTWINSICQEKKIEWY